MPTHGQNATTLTNTTNTVRRSTRLTGVKRKQWSPTIFDENQDQSGEYQEKNATQRKAKKARKCRRDLHVEFLGCSPKTKKRRTSKTNKILGKKHYGDSRIDKATMKTLSPSQSKLQSPIEIKQRIHYHDGSYEVNRALVFPIGDTPAGKNKPFLTATQHLPTQTKKPGKITINRSDLYKKGEFDRNKLKKERDIFKSTAQKDNKKCLRTLSPTTRKSVKPTMAKSQHYGHLDQTTLGKKINTQVAQNVTVTSGPSNWSKEHYERHCDEDILRQRRKYLKSFEIDIRAKEIKGSNVARTVHCKHRFFTTGGSSVSMERSPFNAQAKTTEIVEISKIYKLMLNDGIDKAADFDKSHAITVC